jgi:hypothetical protein
MEKQRHRLGSEKTVTLDQFRRIHVASRLETLVAERWIAEFTMASSALGKPRGTGGALGLERAGAVAHPFSKAARSDSPCCR